jgi:hypothetical protein
LGRVRESSLRRQGAEIVFQQHRHKPDLPECPLFGRYQGQSRLEQAILCELVHALGIC